MIAALLLAWGQPGFTSPADGPTAPDIAARMAELDHQGRHAEAVALAGNLNPATAPLELHLPWARALRNLGRFNDALDVLNASHARAPEHRDARIVRAMLLAETGQTAAAVTVIEQPLAAEPEAVDINLAAAYVYRLAQQPLPALAAAQRVLARHPEHAEAFQHQVFALAEVGAAERALTLAGTRPELFSADELIALRGDRAAQQVRWGQIEHTDPERRFDGTDAALDLLDTALQTLPPDADGALARARHDRVLALRQREHMTAAVDAYEALLESGAAPPPYVTQAAADAYLYLRRPRCAAALYETLLEDDPRSYNLRTALYWALIESERFADALELIDTLAAEQPPFERIAGTSLSEPNWRKLHLDITAAMARALANQPGAAQTRLESLVNDAPASAQIRRELATVYRWRGWPHRALEEIKLAQAYEPEVVAGQLAHAAVLLQLERFEQAGERIEALYRTYPENTHVQRQYAEWRDRDRWTLSVGGEYGDSDGFREFGSRDRRVSSRLSAPWLAYHWQPYVRHDYADARFPEGSADYDRIGLGLGWRRQRHHAYAELHRSRTGSAETGATLGYDFHLGDHWSFAARHETFSTDVPLRARNQGLDGHKSEAAVRWRAHESLSLRLGASRLSISDGNVRLAGLLTGERRVFASAHHITTVLGDLYASRASQTGGPYFNPERDASFTLGLRHDWLTWRRYERTFTQRFLLGGGGYWQEGFGTHVIGTAGYEHEWALSRRLRLRYGVGVASRVYDGERERRVHGHLQLEALF